MEKKSWMDKIKRMKPHKNLNTFLTLYNSDIQSLVMELRGFITFAVPEANELIWDNYNALAIAYSKSEKLKDAFCHLSVYTKHVNFGFNRGVELNSLQIPLEGKGKLIRHYKVKNFNSFPKEIIKKMLFEAVEISESYNQELIGKKSEGKSIIMSISKKKRRPNQ